MATGNLAMPIRISPATMAKSAVRWLAGERGQLTAFTVLWLSVTLLPMLGVALFSFMTAHGMRIEWSLSFAAYQDIIASGRWQVVVRTLAMASAVTAICLVTGFPFALWLAKRARSEWLKQFVWMCLTVPFFLDPSARTLAWRTVLGASGFINALLLRAGLVQEPVSWLLFSDFSVGFGLTAPYFPNMVWPVYLALVLIDDELILAAKDLGATPFETLRDIILPLAMPGIVAGVIFTFVPILGDNVTTSLLGGGKREYLADSVTSLVTNLNYAGAAAFSTIILGLTLVLLMLFWISRRGRGA